MGKPAPKPKTPEERKEILKKVAENKKAGDKLDDACKKAGITTGTYYNWQPKNAKAKKKPAKAQKAEMLTIPYDVDQPMVILMGKPSEINAALAQLSQIGSQR